MEGLRQQPFAIGGVSEGNRLRLEGFPKETVCDWKGCDSNRLRLEGFPYEPACGCNCRYPQPWGAEVALSSMPFGKAKLESKACIEETSKPPAKANFRLKPWPPLDALNAMILALSSVAPGFASRGTGLAARKVRLKTENSIVYRYNDNIFWKAARKETQGNRLAAFRACLMQSNTEGGILGLDRFRDRGHRIFRLLPFINEFICRSAFGSLTYARIIHIAIGPPNPDCIGLRGAKHPAAIRLPWS